MDVPRGKEVARKRLVRRAVLAVVAVIGVGGASYAVAHLKPAVPSAESAEMYMGTVRRGDMQRQVRGLGRLTPQSIYFIAAFVDSRVQKIVRRPGLEPVKADDVLLVLSNPDLEYEAERARWQVKQDQAALENLRVKLQSDKLDQRAGLAALESQYTQARLQSDRDAELTRLNLKSDLESRLSIDQAKQFQKRVSLQQERLDIADQAIKAQLEAQQVLVESSEANYALKKKQVDQLTVRAGVDGVLQEVNVEVGQRVTAGTILSKVADPKQLKAELKIPETQMKDVRIGLDAAIDTRNGVVPGRVIRIDPAAQNGTVLVDVQLLGALPPDARPELSVDGTISIERLHDILFVERPVSAEPGATLGLFKLEPQGKQANRVSVKLGRASVDTIEVREGLTAGDRVILSDTSRFDAYNRIRLN